MLCSFRSETFIIESSMSEMSENPNVGMNVTNDEKGEGVEVVVPKEPPSITDTSPNKVNNTIPPQSTSMEVSSSSANGSLASRIWVCARWTGLKVFYTMDYIGEIVCHVLGLDESRYQYVIDGMDENDWRQAREIQARKDRAAQGEV